MGCHNNQHAEAPAVTVLSAEYIGAPELAVSYVAGGAGTGTVTIQADVAGRWLLRVIVANSSEWSPSLIPLSAPAANEFFVVTGAQGDYSFTVTSTATRSIQIRAAVCGPISSSDAIILTV